MGVSWGMRSYGQYCPVTKAAELLGDRWTLLIVRELLFGPLRFGELERGLPGISRSVLSQRLKRLQRDGIIETVGGGVHGYRFTQVGEALRPVVQTLGDWVASWLMGDPSPAELNPELLALLISRDINHEALPDHRVVVQLELRHEGTRRLWLTLERHDVSVCLEDPCLPVDVVVKSRTEDLYRVYMGRATLAQEVVDGRIVLEGLPRMVRAFPKWMKWSIFAPAARAGATRRDLQ